MKSFTLVLGGVLGLTIIILVALLLSLQSQNARFQNEMEVLEENYRALRTTATAMQQDKDNLQSQVQSLQSSAQDSTRKLEQTKERIHDFEVTVRDSMEWFRQNNNFKNINGSEEIKSGLRERCLSLESGFCNIDLHCIYEINAERGFSYDEDISLTQRDDFLQSLEAMYSKNRGDCEDFSLLFTSQYNFLAEQCLQNVSRKDIRLFTGDNTLGGSYMYPVCGNFDPQGLDKNYAGHCLVAITGEPINRSDNIYQKLRQAVLVEPQTGEYVLDLNDTASISLFDNGSPPTTLYYLNTIITEDDLKLFYIWGEEVEWIGYADFLDDIEKIGVE